MARDQLATRHLGEQKLCCSVNSDIWLDFEVENYIKSLKAMLDKFFGFWFTYYLNNFQGQDHLGLDTLAHKCHNSRGGTYETPKTEASGV